MKKTKLRIDFNEMLDDSLCLLSREDQKLDTNGKVVNLYEGLEVDVYMEDLDENGKSDPLIASGTVELNASTGWSADVKWCIRIDERGIRPQSDLL